MPTALVTGPAVSWSVPLSSIACYIQLPPEDTGNTGDEDRRSGVAPTLFIRFDTIGLVARLLTPDATAVLVVDDAGEVACLPDPDLAERRAHVPSLTTDYWMG